MHTLSKDRAEKGKKDTDDIYFIALNTEGGKVVMEQSRASKPKIKSWSGNFLEYS